MSDDNKAINEFDLDLVCEYFSLLERQGPGSEEVTLKALSFIENLNENSCIADIGCGTGGQTITLAKHIHGVITGVDIFPRFIDLLNRTARRLNLHKRVKGIVGSMFELPFREEEIDLIWSEGAIYFIGFEQGLREWRRFIKPGGYVAVTEASWFTYRRPDEINRFWMDAYPGIDTIPNKIAQLQNAGYIPVASFILPDKCWTENYYEPQVKAQEIFLAKHKGNKMAEDFITSQRYEAELFSKYKDYYGYVFYIGKKV
ncbi:MAG: class I SAM-dependent methyltransferase [Bacteroidales bacterium]